MVRPEFINSEVERVLGLVQRILDLITNKGICWGAYSICGGGLANILSKIVNGRLYAEIEDFANSTVRALNVHLVHSDGNRGALNARVAQIADGVNLVPYYIFRRVTITIAVDHHGG